MEEARPIKALVVDDAAFMRKQLVEALSRSGEIEVVAVARHGLEALEAIKTLKPDVITLDVDMPVMDGLTTIKHIMVKNPIPVVMVSGLADQGKITFEALRLGAIDFFPKPSGTISKDIKDKSEELIKTLRVAANTNPKAIKRAVSKGKGNKKDIQRPEKARGVVVVLARQGAVSSFIRLLSALNELKGVGFVCIQDISPTVLSAYSKELGKFFSCSPLNGRKVAIEAGRCIVVSESRLPVLKREAGGLCLVPSQHPMSLDEALNRISEGLGERLCLVVLGGQVPREVSFVDRVISSGGDVIALSPEKCACSELSKFILENGKGQVASSEQELWEKIRGFSRRIFLQGINKGDKQVKNP